MTPEQCAREYIRYTTVINSLDKGNLKFILCGANGHDVAWTRRLLAEWSARKWHEAPTYGMSIHYYTNLGYPADPVNFTEDEWYLQLFRANFMRQALDDHRAAMDEFDPDRKIGLIVDEWGNWHRDGSGPSNGYNLFEQQSNLRDAVVAAMTLNMFNNRCDSVVMANVAQLCNNLHALYLAGGEHFVETPNYHVFDMFKTHQDARHLNTLVATAPLEREGFRAMETLSVSASEKAGVLTVTVANLNLTEAKDVKIAGLGGSIAGKGTVTVLAHNEPRTCNTFENPKAVMPAAKARIFGAEETVTIPAAGIVSIVIERE